MSAARDVRRAILPRAATEAGEGGGAGEKQPQPPAPQLLRAAAGFIAWVTSSLAGIGAILYVTGYLSTVAQLHLLGLGRLIAYPSEHYLEQGGNFFIAIGPTLLLVVLLLSLILLALSLLPSLWQRRTGGTSAPAAEGKAGRLAGAWRGALYALLLLVLFARFDLDVFAEPLILSNLLLADPAAAATAGPAGSAELLRQLAAGARRPLEAAFSWRLYQEVLIVGLFVACWHVTLSWRFRVVALLPFAVAALLYTVFLPMLYGVLMGQMQFPVASLELADAAAGAAPPRVLLLSKGEQEFLLFDREHRKLVWLPRDRVHRLEISGSETLLGPPTATGR
jgi:hypothetical protein